MHVMLLLAFLSCGFLCSCSQKEQPQTRFGPGPSMDDTEDNQDVEDTGSP